MSNEGQNQQQPPGREASAHERLVTQHEGYPEGWVRVTLMVAPNGKEMHAIGGDREPGKGDTPYIGLERIRKARQEHQNSSYILK